MILWTVSLCGIHLVYNIGKSCFLITLNGIMRYSMSTCFSIFQFFITIFRTVDYAAFTWYTILESLAFWSRWMIPSTLFSSVLSATKISLSEWLSWTIFSWHFRIFCNMFSHVECWSWIRHGCSWWCDKF